MIHSMEITMPITPYMCYGVCRLTTRRTAVRLYKSVYHSPVCQDVSSSFDVSSSVIVSSSVDVSSLVIVSLSVVVSSSFDVSSSVSHETHCLSMYSKLSTGSVKTLSRVSLRTIDVSLSTGSVKTHSRVSLRTRDMSSFT
jgi:hypothetical protein